MMYILMAQAPAGMTQEEIHAHNMHGLYILLILVGIWLGISIITTIINKLLKKTNENCTDMSIAWMPIGHIACFFCRIFHFIKNFTKLLKIDKQNIKLRQEKRKNDKILKRQTEEDNKRKIEEERLRNRIKGLTDI